MSQEQFYSKLSQNVSDETVEFVRNLEEKLKRKAGSMSLTWTSTVREDSIHFSVTSSQPAGMDLQNSGQEQIKGEDGFEVTTEGDVRFIGAPFQGIVPVMYGEIDNLDVNELQENWSKIRQALQKTCHKINSAQT